MNDSETWTRLKDLLEEVTEEWDLEELEMEPATRLSADLGFSSVDVVQLFAAISAKFGRKFRYDTLIVNENGSYRDELTLGEIAEFVEGNLG